jgi:uncharacterized protein (TIGR02391 family)
MAPTLKNSLPPLEIVLRLPREELALHVLTYLRGQQQLKTRIHRRDFVSGSEVKEYAGPRASEMSRALTEAWMWLEREGLIAPDPDPITDGRDWMYVTKQGESYRTEADVTAYRHAQMLQSQALDPELAEKVLPLFRPDDYDTPIFRAFKVVETRVRAMAKLPDDMTGVELMRAAFHPQKGPLADHHLPDAEREAMAHFFAGAFGLFRNPSGHREHVDDAAEAAGRIICANVLLRILASLPWASPAAAPER